MYVLLYVNTGFLPFFQILLDRSGTKMEMDLLIAQCDMNEEMQHEATTCGIYALQKFALFFLFAVLWNCISVWASVVPSKGNLHCLARSCQADNKRICLPQVHSDAKRFDVSNAIISWEPQNKFEIRNWWWRLLTLKVTRLWSCGAHKQLLVYQNAYWAFAITKPECLDLISQLAAFSYIESVEKLL